MLITPEVQNDERELLLRLRDGDHTAYTQLYKQYSAILYNNVLRLVNDPDAAEDLLQDLFLKVWTNRAAIDPGLAFKGYLFTCSRNLVYDYLRRTNVRQQLERYMLMVLREGYQHIQEDIFYRETSEILRNAIAQLPPQRQKIYTMCKLEGLSYDEVAKSLNIGRATVQDHMVKANRFIKEKIRSTDVVILAGVFSILLLP
jgi:RNA polymerase sigma-70 factor (family 1)